MSHRRVVAPTAPIDVDAIRAELKIPPAFPEAVERDAVAAVARGVWLSPDRPDRTALPLVTLDPLGSRDLDQAVLIEASASGFLVYYAIADVAAWVAPNSPVEDESFHRGATMYAPDHSTPLHPRALSENAASLLPGERRAAVLWTIELDGNGVVGSVTVGRAWVRSVAQLDYLAGQADLEGGRLHPSIAALPAVGRLRQALARGRHAITLDLPEIDVVADGDGGWELQRRAVTPIEEYNAEISLLTGMCAAQLMLDGKVGILRTLPDPNPKQIKALRRATAGIGIYWPKGTPPGDVIARLDGGDPKQAAFLDQAAKLLRGAGYSAFDGVVPQLIGHAGVGAPYAHVTAPLRRLVDRFGTEICVSLFNGAPVPEWVRQRLDQLPAAMAAADQKANALEKACVGAVGAVLLAGREGQEFTGSVLSVDRENGKATVVLDDPPVRAHCAATGLREGDRVRVELVAVDVEAHRYEVRLAGSAQSS